MRTIVVLAGGLGTRVADLTKGERPKALLEVDGRPFLDHKLAELKRLGADYGVLLVGRHGDAIAAHVGDGSQWGLRIDLAHDGPELLGTGGAIRRALPYLPERFWVTYGDTLLDADLAAAEHRRAAQGWEGVMTVLHNRGRWQPSNVRVDGELVTAYTKAGASEAHEHLDYGYLELPAGAVLGPQAEVFDLGAVIAPLIERRALGAFEVQERFHDIGTPEALAETEAWLRSRRGVRT